MSESPLVVHLRRSGKFLLHTCSHHRDLEGYSQDSPATWQGAQGTAAGSPVPFPSAISFMEEMGSGGGGHGEAAHDPLGSHFSLTPTSGSAVVNLQTSGVADGDDSTPCLLQRNCPPATCPPSGDGQLPEGPSAAAFPAVSSYFTPASAAPSSVDGPSFGLMTGERLPTVTAAGGLTPAVDGGLTPAGGGYLAFMTPLSSLPPTMLRSYGHELEDGQSVCTEDEQSICTGSAGSASPVFDSPQLPAAPASPPQASVMVATPTTPHTAALSIFDGVVTPSSAFSYTGPYEGLTPLPTPSGGAAGRGSWFEEQLRLAAALSPPPAPGGGMLYRTAPDAMPAPEFSFPTLPGGSNGPDGRGACPAPSSAAPAAAAAAPVISTITQGDWRVAPGDVADTAEALAAINRGDWRAAAELTMDLELLLAAAAAAVAGDAPLVGAAAAVAVAGAAPSTGVAADLSAAGAGAAPCAHVARAADHPGSSFNEAPELNDDDSGAGGLTDSLKRIPAAGTPLPRQSRHVPMEMGVQTTPGLLLSASCGEAAGSQCPDSDLGQQRKLAACCVAGVQTTPAPEAVPPASQGRPIETSEAVSQTVGPYTDLVGGCCRCA